MDDVVIRSRYPRHNIHNRRKRRYAKDSSYGEAVLRQIVAAVLILLAIVIIKNVNAPLTNYITGKVKDVVFYNIDVKSVYNQIDKAIKKMAGENAGYEGKNPSNGSMGEDNTLTGDSDTPQSGVLDASSFSPDDAMANQKDLDTIISEVRQKFRFVTPLEGIVTSPFGDRMHPTKKTVESHKGTDIDASEGAAIWCALDGVVMEVGNVATYGKYIKVEHGNGLVTVYAHCSEIMAGKGDKVNQGDVIARVGNTGASVGSHLHFEIWKDGIALDPSNFLDLPVH